MCVLLEKVCCYIGFLLYTLVIRATDASSLLLSCPSGSAWIWSIMHAVAQNLLRFRYEGSFPSSFMISSSCVMPCSCQKKATFSGRAFEKTKTLVLEIIFVLKVDCKTFLVCGHYSMV